jgi:hypothetical protein
VTRSGVDAEEAAGEVARRRGPPSGSAMVAEVAM